MGLAWSESDACYFSSSQTIKLKLNMQSVTTVFIHQNIFKNHGITLLHNAENKLLQTKKEHKPRTQTQNTFRSKLQYKKNLQNHQMIPFQNCSHQLSHILLQINLEKLVSNWLLLTIHSIYIVDILQHQYEIESYTMASFRCERRHYLSQRAISSIHLGTALTTACMHFRIALYVYIYICKINY
jgi:hypothetical protein